MAGFASTARQTAPASKTQQGRLLPGRRRPEENGDGRLRHPSSSCVFLLSDAATRAIGCRCNALIAIVVNNVRCRDLLHKLETVTILLCLFAGWWIIRLANGE